MTMNHDPDLDDVLQDDELVRLGAMLRSTRRADPPIDEAFRSDLRRQLMQTAWDMSDGGTPWWRRLALPRTPSLAWVGGAVGVVLIAIVVYTAGQQPGVNERLVITSPIADAHSVQLQQPILVAFNQPMDHKSTEAAVKIAPATYVAFAWNANTLSVQPTSGNLAPNTQYQVTIGPGARTKSGQALASPTTITFVTQPSATPRPTPKPTVRPTPTGLLASEHKLATLPSGTNYTPQWSADSSTIYVIGDKGTLQSVAISDGTVKVLVPDGVSFPAIAPAGDRLAYVRGGQIQILTLASGATADVATASGLTTLSWAKELLMWATSEGVFKGGVDGLSQVAGMAQGASIVSIAPDAAHAVVVEGGSLSVFDLATSNSTRFGGNAAAFLGWSPDGSRFLYTGTDATVVANASGQTIATILSGDTSWSSQDEILVGNDTALFAVRPDGYGPTRLSTGTYHLPVWAPNGTTFAFVRGGSIWSATAPPMPAEPSTIDQASAAVSSFMDARLKRDATRAGTFLDSKGKEAYSGSGLPLLITGDANFSRFYVLAQEITDRHPATARFVVRLVLTKGTLDVSEYEEALTLTRDSINTAFLIHQATAGPTRDLGKGAVVVSVDIAAGSIKVVFDSDLVSESVADGVVLVDEKGKRVGGPSTYANRTVVITGLELAPGASYKLMVLTTVQDVGGRNVPSEYDLDVVGPAAGATTGNQGTITNPPSPEPSPIPTPSTVETPTP